MRNTGRLVALFTVALGATPALALGDVTGTWEGTLACTTASTAGIERTKHDFSLGLYDDLIGGVFGHFSGVSLSIGLIPDPGSPSKGTITALTCSMDPQAGGYTLHLAVTAKEGSEKGTLKGTFVSTSVSPVPGSQLCKVRAKRVDTAIPTPTPGSCPP